MNIRLMPGRRVRSNYGKRSDGSAAEGTVTAFWRTDQYGDWYFIEWDSAPDLAQSCRRNIFTPLRTGGRNPRPLMERRAD